MTVCEGLIQRRNIGMTYIYSLAGCLQTEPVEYISEVRAEVKLACVVHIGNQAIMTCKYKHHF